MKRYSFAFIAILLLIILPFPASSVHADVAPPESPPGGSIVPGSVDISH